MRWSFCPTGAALRDLTEQAHRLSNFLWSRKRPVDEEKLRERALTIEKTLWEQEMESRTGEWSAGSGRTAA